MQDDQGSVDAGNPTETETQSQETETHTDAPWYGKLDDPDLQAWAANKNFAAPVEALNSYRNLEKMFGADKAGRTVVMPGEKAEQQELDDFYNKLGRPEAPDKYEIDLPADADSDFVNWFKTSSHKTGLSAAQAKTMAAEYQAYMSARMEAQTNEQTQQENTEKQALMTKWGAAYDANLAKADAVLAQLGVSNEQILKMKDGWGAAMTAEFFADLHTKIGEGTLVIPDGKTNTAFNNPMSPAEAENKINELKSDAKWTEQYLAGSPSHVAQMENLQQWSVAGAGN